MRKETEPLNIIQIESLTVETTKKRHWREIEICTGILNTFSSGFSSLPSFERRKENESEYVWLLLLIRSLHSIRCAIDLMLKGYYSQAMPLLRTVTEAYFICGTVQDNQEVRDCLMRGKGRINYENLATKMKGMTNYNADYRYQSKFTHSSNLSLGVLHDLDTGEVRVAPRYDETLFLLCVQSLMRVSLLILPYMGQLILYFDKDKTKSWDEQISHHIKAATSWLGELRAKYGEDTIN